MPIDQSNYLPIFQTESLDLLEKAESHILAMESGADGSVIHDIFRGIHTIKGNSGLFRVPGLTELAHALEGLLNQMRETGTRPDLETIDLILTAVDRLREMIRAMGTAEDFDNSEILVKLINKKDAGSIHKETGNGHSRVASPPKAQFRIEIPPAKLLEMARTESCYLSFVHLFPPDHGLGTTAAASRFMESLMGANHVSRRGLRSGADGALYMYFFLVSRNLPEIAMSQAGVTGAAVQVLHSPEAASIIEETSTFETGKSEVTRKARMDEFVKIPTTLVDELINLSGESVVARNELLMKIARFKDPEVDSIGKKISRLISSLQEKIIRTRLQKLEISFSRLPRLVRDVAQATGKQVELTILGSEVELDKNLIAVISDPLTHILRNSVDHGIEPQAERTARGKPAAGQITIQAVMAGGNIVITIQDDGKGLDTERLRTKAVESGHMTAELAALATPERLHDLIFLPGFSTAERVTETSGRGVGMDVVRSNVQSVGGRIDLESQPGLGTTFRISLPQTLTIVTCLLARTANHRFAIVQKDVEEVMRIDPASLSRVEDRYVYQLRGKILPVLDLSSVLNFDKQDSERYIIVLRTDRYRFGILCHRILDQQEFVLKPLGEDLQNIQTYAGAGLLGDGDAVLVLDISGIARQASLEPAKEDEDDVGLQADTRSRNSYFLFRYKNQQFAIHSSVRPGLRKVSEGELFDYLGHESLKEGDRILPVIRLDRYFGNETPEEPGRKFALIVERNGKAAAILASKMLALLTRMEDLGKPVMVTRGIVGEAILEGLPTAFLDIDTILDDHRTVSARARSGEMS
ncbi:MAG: chemotaxis protein CheW [Spirochaetia bacterium]|nr:chemotaxis protein CheW [Spirochaetia bacterium]